MLLNSHSRRLFIDISSVLVLVLTPNLKKADHNAEDRKRERISEDKREKQERTNVVT